MTLTYDPVGASKFAAELRELQEENAADDIGISARALELAQAIADFTEAGDDEGLVKFVESLPKEERIPGIETELARACTNIGIKTNDREWLKRALRVLDDIPEDYSENFWWYLRRGTAYLRLEQVVIAQAHFKAALDFDPDDEEAQDLLEETEFFLHGQPFEDPFRTRVEKAWAVFAKEAPELDASLRKGGAPTLWTQRRAREILEDVLPEDAALMVIPDPLSPKDRTLLAVSPCGWRLNAFITAEIVRRAPKIPGWRIIGGAEAFPKDGSDGVRFTICGRKLTVDNVWVWRTSGPAGRRTLFWSEELEGIGRADPEERDEVLQSLEWLLKTTVGEAAQMHWLGNLDFARKKSPKAVLIRDFAEVFAKEEPASVDFTMEDHLKAVTEGEGALWLIQPDFPREVGHYRTACVELHEAFVTGNPVFMKELEKVGATAGVLMTGCGEDASANEREAFRRELADYLATVPADVFRRTGDGTGAWFDYVEGIVWDSTRFLDALADWMREGDRAERFPALIWHPFLRHTGGIELNPARKYWPGRDEWDAEDDWTADEEDFFEASDDEDDEDPDEVADGEFDDEDDEELFDDGGDDLDFDEKADADEEVRTKPFVAEGDYRLLEDCERAKLLHDAEERLRDHFEGFMKRIGWEYDVEPTTGLYFTGVTLSEPLKDVRIAVEIESEILQAYTHARSIVPEANRPAAAEFLMRANLGLKRGAFELDMDTGIMHYHTYVDVPLDAGLPSEQTLRNFLLLPVGMFEQYGKSFVEVALGKKTPARAVEEAESLVRGTPDGFPTVIGTAEA